MSVVFAFLCGCVVGWSAFQLLALWERRQPVDGPARHKGGRPRVLTQGDIAVIQKIARRMLEADGVVNYAEVSRRIGTSQRTVRRVLKGEYVQK